MKKATKKGIIILCFITILGSNNYIWFRLWKKEQEKLTHAIIPTLTNDYFLTQVALSKNNTGPVEFEKGSPEIDKLKREVPLILQNPEYPNGCEIASAVMLLNYYGIEVSMSDLIEKYLMKENVYEKEGKRYGPNPALYYAGNPKDSKRGWGCFEPVVANTIQNFFKDYRQLNPNMEITFIQNELKLPLSAYPTDTYPMMIWTTMNYEQVKEVYEWFSFDKKNTYTYPKNAHVVVITGQDDLYYYINDPLKEEKNIPVEKEKLEKSFDSLGRQMLAIDFIKYDVTDFFPETVDRK